MTVSDVRSNCPNCGSSQMSRLSDLLAQVRLEESTLQGARKETLLDIARCVLYGHGSKEECREAVAILAKYRLARLANDHPRFRKLSWELIELEEAKPYEYRCSRCGLPISSQVSLRVGLGRVCRKKVALEGAMNG
jgi:ribosomal protein S27AE